MSSPMQSDSAKSLVRRALFAVVIVVVGMVTFSSCVARVDAGHVGIRVKLAGSSRGVDDIPVVTGWVFYNPLTEQLVMFPTSVQNITWTKDPHEGNPVDESITFSSKEGANINADIGLSFHIEPSLAPHLYLRFRKSDMIDLANGYVRNAVRDDFNLVASNMGVEDVYGAQKSHLLTDVLKRLQEQLGKDGFIIDQLTINGTLRLPDNVTGAINRRIEQVQAAIQAENRVRMVKAEAEQAITQAEGQSEAARARARGEADARLITARAEAKANLILKASVSGTVLQYRALERWNGKLPLMNGGGALPLLTFDASKVAKADAEDEQILRELMGEEKEDKVKEDKDKADAKTNSPRQKDGQPVPVKGAPPAPAPAPVAAPADPPKP